VLAQQSRRPGQAEEMNRATFLDADFGKNRTEPSLGNTRERAMRER
jgi:hypothetical protein